MDTHECITAESLSQRYAFSARLASRVPTLRTIVHDDACHLKLMCVDQKDCSAISRRLADFNFIVDRFHASGHVGEFCARECLPDLPRNKEILDRFPTDIAETVNSQFSPLGHLVHHQGKWFCNLFLQEMCDVHNMTRLQAIRDRSRASAKKRKAAAE